MRTISRAVVDDSAKPSKTLFDDPDGNNVGNGADLKLYQGGDWQGIIDKTPT